MWRLFILFEGFFRRRFSESQHDLMDYGITAYGTGFLKCMSIC